MAGLLILFYGQPLSRVLALKRSTVKLDHDHGVWIKLGRHPTRLRPPLSKLVLELANRPTTGVVSNGADSDWLFVGQRPGRPLSEVRMSVRLRALAGNRFSSDASN